MYLEDKDINYVSPSAFAQLQWTSGLEQTESNLFWNSLFNFAQLGCLPEKSS